MTVDSISRPEFHAIFDRVSKNIDLKLCTTAQAIEEELKDARDRSKVKYKTARASDYARTREKAVVFGRRAEWLDTLIEHDFSGRAIFEAHREPKGIVALTLIHGRQMARQRILAQKRAALRWVLSQRAPGVPRFPRRPEFRRIPTYRRRRWFRGEQS
jgi:hypothetical protein